MSRLIIKNLPNKITDKKLKELFSSHGVVTDVQLKYNAKGKFRNFGFIGFQSEQQAEAAQKAFHKTFINTSQIKVEICTNLGDPNKPRSWNNNTSTIPKENGANSKDSEKQREVKKKQTDKKIKDSEVTELLEAHKNDELFKEFMEAHIPSRSDLWGDTAPNDGTSADDENIKKEADKSISDLEYLKIKTKKDPNKSITEQNEPKHNTDNRIKVKILNVPYKSKRSDVKRFLKPAKPLSVRIPVKMKGIAYCDFESEKELRKALTKNRSFFGGKRILIRQLTKFDREKEEKTWKSQEDKLADIEAIGESGRIFVRNLAYTLLEDELKAEFEKHGPVTEIIMPVDPITRKLKGFALVTFLIPEHASAAYSALDGTILHGRMLHLLPCRSKVEDDEDDSGLTFAQKKTKKLKTMAKNSINWNTFFINENCLAEAMAAMYNTTKSKVLSEEGGGAAVRLALGETQMVQQTKEFLVNSGILLEAFENMADTPKSNTVILVKNLPYATEVSELREKFAPFGELSNVFLSPYGGTAIIEFIEPSEAQKAFKRLAYSKFRHIPLYLEWAPKNIFDGRKKLEEEKLAAATAKAERAVKDEKAEDVNEPPRIPVDGATLYVKGINFSTGSESLKKHFETCGQVVSAIIAEKRDPQNPGKTLSMGYGFVEFADVESADNALKALQFSKLDDHTIELKRSNRTTKEQEAHRSKPKGKPSTKILVRNVPFQATESELRELFRVFGEIKSLRLPKKMVGTGSHRGFCFVEFHTIADAKRSFKALSESTHLYGRRLVLEWAEVDDDVETLRKKTARKFTGGTGKRKNMAVDDILEDDEL